MNKRLKKIDLLFVSSSIPSSGNFSLDEKAMNTVSSSKRSRRSRTYTRKEAFVINLYLWALSPKESSLFVNRRST